ncbi:hypothetical protein CcaverHIS002_0212160 [Cutaneotrichosporon cavernicola]|uniref:Uncharacterized protein n=1 Tax=Cutaneotrichosporon cavernicola TaxID=279322 RepID=A0AA48L1L6_9TREE|nr:uncharacterized protein CcaverHIS019_0212170 [Cutaneotrichosporon cavernicola]BEI82056.1 hypothetical protein CcaverHIS002_0212160 [Cutaneotrichosporon cavernicola]BEI89855.1 hypothetical protein CcaverHIS019_0212170 [Cutaneotrichosporon cavernicola]BEI97625.1 hypothetical protein CcaverHIS631_0212140 [Cutaneotrichosporon cavernicola]
MATPALVLDALREHLEPTLLTKRLPSVLQLAAHLTLVRQRITHEASMLEAALADLDVDQTGMETLHRLSVADGDALFEISLDMRREQLLSALAAGKVATVEGLVEQYLPEVETTDSHKHIYVRAMEVHQVSVMAEVRKEVLELVQATKAGQQPQILLGQTLNELGVEMMGVARSVVEDAEAFMALFPGERRRESLPMPRRDIPRRHAPRMTMPAPASTFD